MIVSQITMITSYLWWIIKMGLCMPQYFQEPFPPQKNIHLGNPTITDVQKHLILQNVLASS